jgi:hypothetical protein
MVRIGLRFGVLECGFFLRPRVVGRDPRRVGDRSSVEILCKGLWCCCDFVRVSKLVRSDPSGCVANETVSYDVHLFSQVVGVCLLSSMVLKKTK